MITVNALGDTCPIPVVKAKNAIRELNGAGQVEVLVDNEIAVQNLKKLAEQKGYGFSGQQLEARKYRALFTVEENGTLEDQVQEPETAQEFCPCGNRRNVVVAVSSSRMGEGDEQLGNTLMKNVAGIDAVLPSAQTTANIRNGQETVRASVNGVYSSYFDVNKLELDDGRFFSAADNINRRQVAVLGSELAEELFPAGSAVGQYISLFRNQAKRYLVVGVLSERSETLGNTYDSACFIPYNTYAQRLRRITMPSSYSIMVAEGANAVTVADETEDYLFQMLGDDDYYIVYSPATLVEMSNDIMSTFTLFLSCIAGISLLVGGIGIMNIMLVSVVERTREIGIRKALGASPRTIRGQFLVESITITLFGGIIGIAIGLTLSYFTADYAGWHLALSYSSILFAIGFSTLVGVFFGWYPALKAAALDPIEALSYE